MTTKRARLVVIVLAAGLALAACSSSPKASTTTSSGGGGGGGGGSSTTASGGGGGGGGGGGSLTGFCGQVKNYQTSGTSLAGSLTSAMESGDLTKIKEAYASYFHTVDQAMTRAQALFSNVPANVKAALQTVINFFNQLASSVANASSLTDLTTAAERIGTSAQLKAASATLQAYYVSKCGPVTTTT